MSHIVFFDKSCGLCQNAVRWILLHDTKKQFLFAPLEGKTAKRVLYNHFDTSTLVLVESPYNKRWLRGKAVFRILWLLGGKWKGIGWMTNLPFINLFYRLIAACRSWFFQPLPSSTFEKFKNRFLP